jgi:hypothetical protein
MTQTKLPEVTRALQQMRRVQSALRRGRGAHALIELTRLAESDRLDLNDQEKLLAELLLSLTWAIEDQAAEARTAKRRLGIF